MINEIFDGYIVTYSLSGYWRALDIRVVEVWPQSGTTVDINIVNIFKEKILND